MSEPTETVKEPKPEQKPEPQEHMVPISRLNEKIDENKELKRLLQEKEDKEKAETEKRLVEQQEYQKLAETRGKELADLQPKAAKVDDYERTLLDVLKAQVEDIPEDKRSLVPDELTTPQKLSWIARNKAILKAPDAFDIGAGKTGGSENKTKVELSPEEISVAGKFGMTPEEYAQNKK